MMRLRTVFVLALLTAALLLCPLAAAETGLTLSAKQVPALSVLDFTVTGEEATGYRYTLLKDGEELFTTEASYAFGSYLPRETGSYTLQATPLTDGVQITASADFIVVDALTLAMEADVEDARVSSAVEVRLSAQGGTPPYQYVYAVTRDGALVTEQLSAENWYWTPTEQGEYLLHGAVIDALGVSTMQILPVTVQAGEGVALLPTGGGLYAHGGQMSWLLCTGEPWTAQLLAPEGFRLETPSGQPGDPLVVTVSSAEEPRQAALLVQTQGEEYRWDLHQSALENVDEEVYLFTKEKPVYIDSLRHAAWTGAEGSRSFTVTPAGEAWQATTGDDFLHVDASGDTLTVTVDKTDSAAVRSGTVTVSTAAGCAYLHVYQLPGHPEDGSIAASGLSWEPSVRYSQFSGLWKDEKYGSSTLEHSGCAIFALAHALDHLGVKGEDTLPRALAKAYAFCLRDGGTVNATLIGNAGNAFGFKTRYELYKDLPTIRQRLEQGAVFSFAVVNGHIALVVEQNEDGSMMRIVDSAPSATWERIKNASLYRREEDGSFTPITDLTQLDDMRFYVENNAFGAATYWLEDSYVARRGVRLIQLRDE